MGEYFFGVHEGHLSKRVNAIAEKHGATHVNYSEPTGHGQYRKRGWFACRNRGNPFDLAVAKAVLGELEAKGGFDAFRLKSNFY